jgi:hypothetical protein
MAIDDQRRLFYFGAGPDIGRAFELSLWQLSAFAVEIVMVSRLLPRPARRAFAP